AAAREPLDSQDQQLLDDYLLGFRRNGLDLPQAQREELTAIRRKLVELSTEFSTRLGEWTDALEVTRAQLEGLPESYIESLERTPECLYKISLAYPEYYPFMQNAKDEAARQALEDKYGRRGGERNREILQEMIALRAREAELLGYD